MLQTIRTAAVLLGLLTLLTGIVYPVIVTVVAQVAFPKEANGSLFKKPPEIRGPNSGIQSEDSQRHSANDETWAGSELIGQSFRDPKYFWGRPSATGPVAYNGMGGSGSNLAPTNPALLETVRERVAKLRAADPGNDSPVPVDLVTASSSGLDPHISEAAALYQVGRVARVRDLSPSTVNKMVLSQIERPTIGVFGQSRVNVLKLNLALDTKLRENSSTDTDPTP